MAAATKSLDTDFLSLRTVFVKNTENQNISSTKVLTTDGKGGLSWVASQMLGQLPTFNAFETSVQKYTATETNRTLRLNFGDGITMNSSTLYGTSLTYIDVSGTTSLSNSKIKIATTGFVSVSTDKNTNTISLSSSKPAPGLSNGDLYFQTLKVVSSVQAPVTTTPFGTLFSSKNYDFYTTFAAVSPLAFSTFTTTKQVFLSMYPYTAAGFLKMSTTAGNLFISSFSTISTLYITKTDFSTGMGSISSTQFLNYSTNVSSLVKLSNDSEIKYLNAVGNTLARAYIVQLTDQFGILNTGLSTVSTNKTTKSLMLEVNASIFLNTASQTISSISTFGGSGLGVLSEFTTQNIFAFSTQLSTLSTSMATNLLVMSNTLNTTLNNFIVSTSSTFNQLGSIGYISSTSFLATVASLPYVSSNSLQASVRSLNVISSPSLISSFSLANPNGLYIERSRFIGGLQSTVKQINENNPYISTLTFLTTLQSTTVGITNNAGNFGYTSTISLQSTAQGIVDNASFNGYVSSISTLSFTQYISTKTLDYSLYSTTNAVFSQTSTISTASFTSTVNGLGQLYLSTVKTSSFPGIVTSTLKYAGSRSLNSDNTFIPEYLYNTNIDNTQIVYPPEGDYYFIYPSIIPFYDVLFTHDIILKTAELNISQFSTFINDTSRVQIDFNMNIYISSPSINGVYYSFPDYNNRLLPISSYLTYDTQTYPLINIIQEATSSEHVYSDPIAIGINLSKRISFTILGKYIKESYVSNRIVLRHRIENYSIDPYTVVPEDIYSIATPYTVYPSPTNSIFVSIYN